MVIYEKIYKNFGLSSTQLEIIKKVGQGKEILEIGPSTGYMTRFFLKNNCVVDVIENDQKVFSKLPKGIRNIYKGSAEDKFILNKISKNYHFIIMADVLEHLIDPEAFLKKLHQKVSKNVRLLISMPNIASWVMRKQLFFKGDFEYQQSGLLDKTHLHFYTINSLPKLLNQNGWRIEEIIGTVTRLPLEGLINKIPIVGFLFKKLLYKKIVEKFKNLSYYHFLTVAAKK